MLDYICDLRLRVRVPKLLALYKAGAGMMSSAAMDEGAFTKEELEQEKLHKLTEKLRTNHGDDLTKLLSFLSLSGPVRKRERKREGASERKTHT